MHMKRRSGIALAIASSALFLLACSTLTSMGPQEPATPTEDRSPGPTATVSAEDDPPANPESIAIQEPGLGSRLVASVRVQGVADPAHEQQLGLRLMAARGEILAEGNAMIDAPLGERGPFQGELAFSVEEEQPALIQVFARSARDGKITDMSSTPVLLSPSGEAEVRTDLIRPETILVLAPVAGDEVVGGTVNVRGRSVGLLEGALVIEVQNADGGIVGQKPLSLNVASAVGPATFDTEVGYAVREAGPGRILIREPSTLFGRAVHITTVEIDLQP